MTTPDPYHGTDPVVLDPAPMPKPKPSPPPPAVAALLDAADAAAAAGYCVALVCLGQDEDGRGADYQYVRAAPQRMKVLGALRIVEADILDDTPRDDTDA